MTLAQRLAAHRTRFPGPHLQMVLDSMMAGNTAGELWNVARKDEPPLLILWDKGNDVFYLAGESHGEPSLNGLAEIIAGQVLPLAADAGVRRFKVHPLSPFPEQELPRLFPGVGLRPSVTHFFVHDATRPAKVQPHTASKVAFLPITPALLNGRELAGISNVREEINGMWPSEDRFNENGFGVLAVVGSEIVCWCTAEYVGPAYCGIGIATSPGYRRQGIATAAAATFVIGAGKRGVMSCWECDGANIGSVRVADKCGFVRQAEEMFWIGRLPET